MGIRIFLGVFFFIAVMLSIIFGMVNGKTAEVSAAALEESAHAAEISFRLLGSLCFWSGVMKIAEKSGLINLICKVANPLLMLIFPSLRNEKKALQYKTKHQ